MVGCLAMAEYWIGKSYVVNQTNLKALDFPDQNSVNGLNEESPTHTPISPPRHNPCTMENQLYSNWADVFLEKTRQDPCQ